MLRKHKKLANFAHTKLQKDVDTTHSKESNQARSYIGI